MLMQIQEYLQLLVRITGVSHGGKPQDYEFKRVARPWYEAKSEESEEDKKSKEQAEVARLAASIRK